MNGELTFAPLVQGMPSPPRLSPVLMDRFSGLSLSFLRLRKGRGHIPNMKYAICIWLLSIASIHAQILDFKETSKEINAAADATTITAEFEFTNKTEKPVIIKKCDAGCSCMSVRISNEKIRYEPGQSGVIRATFEVGNYSGAVEKLISVFLGNDPPNKPSHVLKLKVIVPVLISLEPKTLKWIVGAKADPKTIQIKIAEDQTIRIIAVKSSSEEFALELKIQEEGRRYDLVVTPKNVNVTGMAVFRIESDYKIQKHRVQQAFAVVHYPAPDETSDKP